MSFHIYFDESNKIDQPNKAFSYYGAYGGLSSTLADTTINIKKVLRNLNTKSEIHFREYNHDQYIKKYFQVINEVINQDININLFIVDNEKAKIIAEQMQLSILELRSLLYVKIPERLFYGILREKPSLESMDIKITVDRNDEYRVLNLYSKIKEQMNAHSVYRNKKYKIKSVKSEHSHHSIPLQIIDLFMGIIVFLIEKSYLQDSNTSIIKSDLIYRFLMQEQNLSKFQRQIKLFKWNGLEVLNEISVSNYLSEFIVFKSNFDVKELTKLTKIISENPNFSDKELRIAMNYPNTMLRMLWGYKNQIQGNERNCFII